MFGLQDSGQWLNLVREVNWFSILLRLCLAILCGGIIGIERGRKGRTAGFRTHVLVCMGSTLTVLTNQYMIQVFGNGDPARLGAQVINGIGFLGAGTILVTDRQEVKGLTTAAGLWASACMGLAIGAGFYECMFLAFALILLCICLLPHIDAIIVSRAHNMNIYVEFTSLDDVGAIIGRIKEQGARIYEVDIIQDRKESALYPCAVFSIRLSQPRTHGRMIMAIYELDRVIAIDEV